MSIPTGKSTLPQDFIAAFKASVSVSDVKTTDEAVSTFARGELASNHEEMGGYPNEQMIIERLCREGKFETAKPIKVVKAAKSMKFKPLPFIKHAKAPKALSLRMPTQSERDLYLDGSFPGQIDDSDDRDSFPLSNNPMNTLRPGDPVTIEMMMSRGIATRSSSFEDI